MDVVILAQHLHGVGKVVDRRDHLITRLAQQMLVVERDERLILYDDDAPDRPFAFPEQHYRKPCPFVISSACVTVEMGMRAAQHQRLAAEIRPSGG